ncbi:MAG: hypothetical protein ACRERU_00610, partial [Methylococcales bacterium]
MSKRSEIGRTIGHPLIIAAIFTCALLAYSLNWFYDTYGDDRVSGAERVFFGQVPYRDFWTLYAPGSFYLLAFLFRIFGQHVLVSTVAGSVFCAANACLCYLLVNKLVGKQFPAVASAVIFFSAQYATGVYGTLGPYPPVVFFILITLNLILVYYQTRVWTYLLGAGIVNGIAIVFKHDVGIYTSISILLGLGLSQILQSGVLSWRGIQDFSLKFAMYAAGVLVISVPVFGYFLAVAGPDMVQDLIVFPGTDFRFARPEKYPGILPIGIYDKWRLKMLFNFFSYLKFVIPFALLLLGLFGLGICYIRNSNLYLPMGLTFVFAFLFHYGSAYIQINTNIMSMSMYAAFLGALCYDELRRNTDIKAVLVEKFIAGLSVCIWVMAIVFQPAYEYLSRDQSDYIELQLPKISGMYLERETARSLVGLTEFIQANVAPGQKIFLGSHRHDSL